MFVRLLFSILACSLLLMPAAQAQKVKMSGSTLHAICNEPRLQIPPLCTGWIMGAIEGMRFGAEQKLNAGAEEPSKGNVETVVDERLGFCVEDVSTEEIVGRVSTFLKNNPDDRKRPGRLVLQDVLKKEYPCS